MSEIEQDIYVFVKQKIRALSQAQESVVKSSLAQLRRGVGKHPGSLPGLWGITLDGLPNALLSTDWQGVPTYGEWSVHTAITLFALHQQGHDYKTKFMSRDGEKFGMAIRKLAPSDDDLPRIKRRFDAVITADSIEEVSQHLRGLVQLLKSKSIPLDYPELAQDLYWFQIQKARDNVRLKWGQDFYCTYKKEESENGK